MSYGYMGKILYVDLSSGKAESRPLDDEVKLYIGGKGYGARLLYDLTPAGVDALGPDNVMIFGTGPYNGTFGPQSTRFTVTTKSPATGAIANCACGGDLAVQIKKCGYDFIVIRGKAEKPVYLNITEDNTEIKDASHLWGMTTMETQDALGKKGGKAVIGPAGENLVKFAAIISGDRVAGRSGVGAVMGSKNLKAMVCFGKKKVEIAEKEKFKKLNKNITQYFRSHPMTGKILPSLGTANLLMQTSGRNTLPVNNFQQGQHPDAWKISGEQMAKDALIKNGGCTACPIKCGREVKRSWKYKDKKMGEQVKGPEYETLGLMGSSIGVFDLNRVMQYNEILDELGMDSISCGGTIAFAMELNQRGMWDNGLEFGDAAKVEQILFDIAYKRGIGEELCMGSLWLSKKYGGEGFAIQVKGLEMAAYDPRGSVGQGLDYATQNRGGCHINGSVMFFEITGPLSVDPLSAKAKPELVIFQQNMFAAINAMITCVFSAYAIIPSIVSKLAPRGKTYRAAAWVVKHSGPILRVVLKTNVFAPVLWYERFLGAITGERYTLGRIIESGERNFNMERLFNVREGFSAKDDTLPKRMLEEPAFPEQKKGVPLDEMLPTYYKLRGWDPNGIPTELTLNRLKIRR